MTSNYRLWTIPVPQRKSLPVPIKRPSTRNAQLVLVMAAFQLVIALARLYTLPAVISSGVNLLEFAGIHSGPAALAVLAGLLQPLLASLVLILASIAVRRGWRLGAWIALLVAAFNIAALLNIGSMVPSWMALAVLSAAQAVQLLWTFARAPAAAVLSK